LSSSDVSATLLSFCPLCVGRRDLRALGGLLDDQGGRSRRQHGRRRRPDGDPARAAEPCRAENASLSRLDTVEWL
jgi:hypothetical protein